MRSSSRIHVLGFILALLTVASRGQQNRPVLKISSPEDGTLVNPGQTIRAEVVSPAGVAFTNVTLAGQNPIGFSQIDSSVPATLSITIPSEIDCRRYTLSAIGVTVSGTTIFSDPIDLIVERPDMPISLSSQFQSLIMEAQGETAPMMLTATFSDKSVVEVTECPRVTYRSTNTAVATVDKFGDTTAVGTGSASIVVTYKNPHGPDVRLIVPVTVLPPQITLSPPSPAFGDVIVGASANLTVTVRNVTASDSNLMVRGITVHGDYSEKDDCVSSSPLAIGRTCGIQITFTPTVAGARPGTLTISTSASEPTIPLSGTGIAPASK